MLAPDELRHAAARPWLPALARGQPEAARPLAAETDDVEAALEERRGTLADDDGARLPSLQEPGQHGRHLGGERASHDVRRPVLLDEDVGHVDDDLGGHGRATGLPRALDAVD